MTNRGSENPAHPESPEVPATPVIGCTSTTHPAPELVDLIDDDDNAIGVVTRKQMRAEVLLHRAVYLVVRSTAGHYLAHQRSFQKDVAPGWWDVAAGGVVSSGETYDDAAHRELAEELGVAGDLVEVGRGRFDHPLYRVMGRVYLVVHDGPFTFADGEVIDSTWIEPHLLDGALADPNRLWCPDSIGLALPFVRNLDV